MQTATAVSGARWRTQPRYGGGATAAAAQTANAAAFSATCAPLTSEPAPPKQPQSTPSSAIRIRRKVKRQNTPYANVASAAVSVLGSSNAAAPMATSASASARTPARGAGKPAVDSDAWAMYGEAIFEAPAITSRIAAAENAGSRTAGTTLPHGTHQDAAAPRQVGSDACVSYRGVACSPVVSARH